MLKNHYHNTSREDILILDVVGLVINKNKELSPILDNISWKHFFKEIEKEEISAIFYEVIRNHPLSEKFPSRVMERLRKMHLSVLYYNVILADCLRQVCEEFKSNSIRFFVFKGFAISYVYSSNFLRQMGDIDILIEKSNLARAVGIISNIGYTNFMCKESLVRKVIFADKDSSNLNSFLYEKILPGGEKVRFHIHWNLSNSSYVQPFLEKRIDFDKIWDNKKEVSVNDISFYTFKDDISLLYLCDHALKHSYSKLSLLLDIILLLKDCDYEHLVYDDRWKALAMLAREFKVEVPLRLTLDIINRLFGISYPKEVLLASNEKSFSIVSELAAKNHRFDGLNHLVYFSYTKGIFRKVWLVYRGLFPTGLDFAPGRLVWGKSNMVADYILRFFTATRILCRLVQKLFLLVLVRGGGVEPPSAEAD